MFVRQNGACISKLASAKLQRKKANSNFFANLWRFEMLKSAHSPVFTGEILFFVAQKCADFNVSLSAKVTPTPILTIDAKNRPICTLFGTVKK